MTGYKAFQDKMMGVDLLDPEHFTDFDARRLRYAILWAMYENTAYSDMHNWSKLYKSRNGLYRYVRAIYNPSYRLGEFWKSRLLGGPLDMDAGDGSIVPSALPIATENEALRPAVAQLWRWSNWQFKKDVLGLRGALLGDGVIKIVDDVVRKKVYMQVVHPGTLKDVTLDPWGNVKGYVIEERRDDPRPGRNGKVRYTEIAERDESDNVFYSTFLDGNPFAWNDSQGAEWSEAYGFVPLVVFQHNNVGLDFGYSELHNGLPKFREIDDLASKLSDQIRKMVDAPWIIGMNKPAKAVKTTSAAGQQTAEEKEANPQPGREEIPMLWAGDGKSASALPLVAPLDIGASAGYIKDILANIEQEYPELSTDLHNVQGDISGRALRINRGPAEQRVIQRRPGYDDAIVRTQKMAVAIGGMRGYLGFEGFDLDSYLAGDLNHVIGDRPVFPRDPQDDLDEESTFWDVGVKAKSFGVPPMEWLRKNGPKYGYGEEDIAAIEKSPEYQARVEALKAQTEASKAGSLPANTKSNASK